MIDVIFEVLFEMVLNPIGGAIRWLVYRKKPLKQYVTGNWESNLGAVGIFLVIIIFLVVLIQNL